MKSLLFLTLMSLAVVAGLRADDAPASFLRSFVLDERTPYQIPVAVHRGMTTLVFPEPPQNFAAARVAFIEPGQNAPDVSKDDRIDFVLLAHRGSTTCSLRAVRPDAHDTLSVFLAGKVYQLFLHADDENPLLTVEFHFRPTDGGISTAAVSPTRLIDCLTRAKAFSLLRKYDPGELDGITHVSSDRVITYPGFRVQISDIFRFDDADTLVFHVLLENQTDHRLAYQRRELSVRVEPQTPDFHGAPPLYAASIVDATGVMPPGSVTSAWFAITGTRNGGRNNLDPARNIFTVLVPRSEFPIPASHAKTTSSPDPKVISL
jgi:hypothetical protein